jgi:hypothetical protein
MRGNWTTGCLAGRAALFRNQHIARSIAMARQRPRSRLFQFFSVLAHVTKKRNTGPSKKGPARKGLVLLVRASPEEFNSLRPTNASINDVPVCRPLRLASFRSVTRAREWTIPGLRITRPSLLSLLMLRRLLASAMSLISLGSIQILRFPHLRTDAARRFCSFRLTDDVNSINKEGQETSEPKGLGGYGMEMINPGITAARFNKENDVGPAASRSAVHRIAASSNVRSTKREGTSVVPTVPRTDKQREERITSLELDVPIPCKSSRRSMHEGKIYTSMQVSK